MKTFGTATGSRLVASALFVLIAGRLVAQQQAGEPKRDDGIPHASGQLIAPVYEGWYRDESGTLYLSFGYLNRNFQQEIDIPPGPDNRIEPGPPDQGQPTHFGPRRQWGAFAVVVPKTLERTLVAEKKAVTWTIRANGQVASVPANLGPAYGIDALKEPTVGNVPPSLRFGETLPARVGPSGVRRTFKAVAGTPTTITIWMDDDGRTLPQRENKSVVFNWTRYRGAGAVTLTDATKSLVGSGKAVVTATFAQPGEYTLRVEAIDTGIHDFQCCWSNAYVDVTVGAGTTEARD